MFGGKWESPFITYYIIDFIWGELMPYNIVYFITQKDSYGDIWSSHEWLKQNQVSRSPSRLLYKSNESGVV